MIEYCDIGVCIGQVGINYGLLFLEKELGWLLYVGQEGQGYVIEVVIVLCDWVYMMLVLDMLVSYMSFGNVVFVWVVQCMGVVCDDVVLCVDFMDLVY